MSNVSVSKRAIWYCGWRLRAEMLDAIENAVRWHYYDCQRGHDTADPACNGMAWEILQGLEALLSPKAVEQLRRQGDVWADYQCGKLEEIDWKDVPDEVKL